MRACSTMSSRGLRGEHWVGADPSVSVTPTAMPAEWCWSEDGDQPH